jgi:hypothetical protein
LKLDATRSWLPLKGRTQLAFLDNVCNLTNFGLKVVDTTEIALNQECGTTYKYSSKSREIYNLRMRKYGS